MYFPLWSMSSRLKENAEIGIIGGTGVYNVDLLNDSKSAKVYTPYGATSDDIIIGTFAGRRICFLPRHGGHHSIPPHAINFRANIWAMRELGVTRIIAPCAVGSLREEMKPGDLVVPDQFIDRTKNRASTFYDGGTVAHISTADPFCPQLRDLAISSGRSMGIKMHESGTQVCIEGPRFSTRAESRMFRSWEADTINMTLVPECVLAREAQICYVPLATVTDYDVWANKPVSAEEVVQTLRDNVTKTRGIIEKLIPLIPYERADCDCGTALAEAIY